MILVKQAVEHLAELPSYTSDGAPDVFIFTFSTLRVSLLENGITVYKLVFYIESTIGRKELLSLSCLKSMKLLLSPI